MQVGGMILREKTDVVRKKNIPLSLWPEQISHVLAWNQTLTSVVDDSGESALYINVSLYLTENTVGVHYKDQLVNAIQIESLLIMDHTHSYILS